MRYWHIQMHLPEGRGKRKINPTLMLQEEQPVIGTGEWENKKKEKHKQCVDFKNVLAIGDVVLVREGKKAIALCEVTGDNFVDADLRKKYLHINYRHVKILQWASDYKQPDSSRLFSEGTFRPCVNPQASQYQYIHQWHQSVIKMKDIQEMANLLEKKKNIILQGAPGTGKTYTTAELALRVIGETKSYPNHTALMEAYEKIRKEGQIEFVTFHQSMDYEDFVEGLKPVVSDENNVIYIIENGIFKRISEKAGDEAYSDRVDNFENSWEKIIADVEEKDTMPLPTLSKKSEFKLQLNTNGDGFVDKVEPSKSTKGYTRTYNHDQLYRVYRGLPGVKGKGHDNYRHAIIRYMKEHYGLKSYSAGSVLNQHVKRYVLIIDEINRGNVSKIFGELITLLEADKRNPVGEQQTDEMHPLSVKLPYSKEEFSVPSNLYIIGTMNTTDRSVGNIDYAVRRRFAFVTLKSDVEVLNQYDYDGKGTKDLAMQLFEKVKKFLELNKFDMDIDDLMVGHSYFCAKTVDDLEMKWTYEIYPLLCEYYKDGICKAKPEADMRGFIKAN